MQRDLEDSAGAWSQAAIDAVARFDPRPTAVRRVYVKFVTMACRTLMQRLNRVEFEGLERFDAAQAPARGGRGLLTFSNHVSLFDDPLLPACFVTPEWERIRWIATDAINFFSTPTTAWLFGSGKGVPIVRGVGIDQMAMHFLAERLRAGDWIHFFPEGTRTREPDGSLSLPLKRGMAHLVQQAEPLMLAFHHLGMDSILPVGARVPSWGQTVKVRFGEVFDSRADLAQQSIEQITAWAQEQLVRLEGLASDPG